TGSDPGLGDRGRDFIARKHPFPANAAGFLVAPVLWFVYFTGIYALQGAGCALGLEASRLFGVPMLPLMLLLVTVAILAAMVLFGVWSYRSWHDLLEELDEQERKAHGHAVFLAYGAILHAGLFLVATVWTAVPILLLDSCDALGST
ncbi:MAG TPA: hypothetical protein VHG33_02825, partial [Woeseiaceae bacterium]|nr:hypothetical protein [Woeseiaceae bacterium]